MVTVFNGTLTGFGIQHISDTGVIPTDMDVWVTTVGNQVNVSGVDGHRLFKRLGYLQFLANVNAFGGTQPNEAVTDPIWFNCESQDIAIQTAVGDTATDFVFWISPGSAVRVLVSA